MFSKKNIVKVKIQEKEILFEDLILLLIERRLIHWYSLKATFCKVSSNLAYQFTCENPTKKFPKVLLTDIQTLK